MKNRLKIAHRELQWRLRLVITMDGMKFLHIEVLLHEALALIEAHSSQAHTQSDASPGSICISC